MGITRAVRARGRRLRAGRRLPARTVSAAAAALLCAGFVVGVISLPANPSGAATTATLYVDNVNGTQTAGCSSAGSGACKTIQEGVTAAQALSGTAATLDVAGSTTTYAESVTINLTTASGDSLDIEGTGSTQPTLDNGGTGSNITISTTSVGAVTIGHMTITGGNNSASDGSGGGILDLGSGTLTVTSDNISGNSAVDHGGAIDAADGCIGLGDLTGDLVVTGSTFSNNQAGDSGGAFDVADCSGSGNLTVNSSTFEGNTGPFAITAWDTNAVTNSTFASNSGAIEGFNFSLVDDTFMANTGDVIYNYDGSSIANSILDDPTATAECTSSALHDDGHNVAVDNSCSGLGPSSIQNSATIGTLALAANGSSGPQTAAITTASSAHGIVPTSACTVITDERGQPRPGVGYGACDAGAYEIQKSTGYDLAGSDGGVFVFPTGQSSGFYGSLPGLGIHVNNVVGLVPTNIDTGYDLAGSDGGVFVFPTGQPSGFYGSLPGLGVKVSNVVGLVTTNNDHGYDLAGRDGGVFVFPTGQSAGFYGSLPGLGVHANDIIGIVAQPGGGGYLLAGRDGGVFAFGSAHYYGSLPGMGVSANNIVAIASTPTGKGYYLVGSNGAVYPFGDAVNQGSLPAMKISVSNIVSIVPTADGGGYWLIGADGGVFAFGDAGFIGSLPGINVHVSNVVGAVPTAY